MPFIYFSLADLDKGLVHERLLPSLEQRVHKELNKAEKYVTSKQGNVNKDVVGLGPTTQGASKSTISLYGRRG